jgi:hypothetical protein
MQQVTFGKLPVDNNVSVQAAVFDYSQRVIQIMFVVISLSCVMGLIIPILTSLGMGFTNSKAGTLLKSSVFSGSLAQRQLNSLMVNMQRTFAETVSSFIPDIQTRKLIVLLGLCMLPSIASVISSGSDIIDIRSIESFFLAAASKRKGSASSQGASQGHIYASFLAKLCIAGGWIYVYLLSSQVIKDATICFFVFFRLLALQPHHKNPNLDPVLD